MPEEQTGMCEANLKNHVLGHVLAEKSICPFSHPIVRLLQRQDRGRRLLDTDYGSQFISTRLKGSNGLLKITK